MRRSSFWMLRGCWLLTDLDGTLVPTPHKAHGHYLNLNEGPCFGALRRWIELGGNICVITTADRRVFDQVYAPLRHLLPDETSDKGDREPTRQLLLSVYTGAVMYRASRQGVRLEPGYVDYQHSLASLLTGEPPETASPSPSAVPHGIRTSTVPVTCIDHSRCDSLEEIVSGIFLAYARDVLFGVPDALKSLEYLSKRYRTLWQNLLVYLDVKYKRFCSKMEYRAGERSGATDPHSRPLTAQAEVEFEAKKWKYAYLRQHRSLLSTLGIVRKEHIRDVPPEYAVHVAEPLQTVDRQKASDSQPSAPAADDHGPHSAATERDPDHETFVSAVKELLGVEPSSLPEAHRVGATTPHEPRATQNSDQSTVAGGQAPSQHSQLDARSSHHALKPVLHETQRPVAQMIVVGMPMKVYSTYFGAHAGVFRQLGVSAIPQPNSVVFSKLGVDKSTAVRYLDADSPRQPSHSAPHALHTDGTAALSLPKSLAHRVNLLKCIALGDNPHTADHQLTVFPRLQFISVEKHDQRIRRHEAISRSGSSGTESGALMDDRKIPHLHYVGGEEDGTNAFLLSLIQCVLERHTNALGRNLASGDEVDAVVFQSAVVDSAAATAHELAARRAQRNAAVSSQL